MMIESIYLHNSKCLSMSTYQDISTICYHAPLSEMGNWQWWAWTVVRISTTCHMWECIEIPASIELLYL